MAPTIADIFGVRGKGGSDREFQGRSLLPVVAGRARQAGGALAHASGTARATRCATSASSSSTTRARARSELFDLTADPGETRDVADEEPLRAAYYRQALHAWTLRLARRGRGGDGGGAAHAASSART